MNRALLLVASVLILAGLAVAGGIRPGQDQTRKNGYRPGVLIVKFKAAAVTSTGLKITKGARGISAVGLASVDALNAEAGVTSVSRDEFYTPRNTALARQLGADRFYALKFPEGSDMVEWAARFAADPNVEAVSLDWGPIPPACRTTPSIPTTGATTTPRRCRATTGPHLRPQPARRSARSGFDANAQAAWDGSQGYGVAVRHRHHRQRRRGRTIPTCARSPATTSATTTATPMTTPPAPATAPLRRRGRRGRTTTASAPRASPAGAASCRSRCANSAGTMSFIVDPERALLRRRPRRQHHQHEPRRRDRSDPATDTAFTYAYNAGLHRSSPPPATRTRRTISYPAINANVIGVGAASPLRRPQAQQQQRLEVNPGVSTDPNGYTCDGERWWGSNYGVTTANAAGAVDVIAPTILPTTDIARHRRLRPERLRPLLQRHLVRDAVRGRRLRADQVEEPDLDATRRSARSCGPRRRTSSSVESGAGWDRYAGLRHGRRGGRGRRRRHR